MLSHSIVIYSLLGGIIPAIFWLNFWLREDKHQEPRKVIFGSFVFGMIAVVLAIPIEHFISILSPDYSILTIFLWASTEELLKFFGAYIVALKTRFNDEPIDATVYLITSALGFAALENVLFLLQPLADGDIAKGVATIHLRFIGATLLHVVSSASIGVFMGMAFYKSEISKKILTVTGILIAITLHTLFNSFIIGSEHNIFVIFSGVWIGLVLVILILEHIKKIKRIRS